MPSMQPMPSLGAMGSGMPGLGSGLSGLGQQFADTLGGLLGGADGAVPELGDPLDSTRRRSDLETTTRRLETDEDGRNEEAVDEKVVEDPPVEDPVVAGEPVEPEPEGCDGTTEVSRPHRPRRPRHRRPKHCHQLSRWPIRWRTSRRLARSPPTNCLRSEIHRSSVPDVKLRFPEAALLFLLGGVAALIGDHSHVVTATTEYYTDAVPFIWSSPFWFPLLVGGATVSLAELRLHLPAPRTSVTVRQGVAGAAVVVGMYVTTALVHGAPIVPATALICVAAVVTWCALGDGAGAICGAVAADRRPCRGDRSGGDRRLRVRRRLRWTVRRRSRGWCRCTSRSGSSSRCSVNSSPMADVVCRLR